MTGTEVTSTTEDWMEQLDRQGLQALAAKRPSSLNDQHSRLLKLPNELLVEIGKFVLSLHWQDLWHNKAWFKQIIPLLQACTHLRTALYPLRSEPLVCRINRNGFYEMWSETLSAIKKWHRNSPHTGVVSVLVSWEIRSSPDTEIGPSSTAAMAAALECQIYGKLNLPPRLHIEYQGCQDDDMHKNGELVFRHYISHAKENFMKCETYPTEKHPEGGGHDYSAAEGAAVWNMAKENGLG